MKRNLKVHENLKEFLYINKTHQLAKAGLKIPAFPNNQQHWGSEVFFLGSGSGSAGKKSTPEQKISIY